MNEKMRTALLGVSAFFLLAYVGFRSFKGTGTEEVVPVAHKDRPGGGSTPTVLASHDRAELGKRFQPIVDADPFKVRNFTPRRGGGKNDSKGRDPDSDGGSSGAAPGFTLRLTGIVVDEQGSRALLEDRANGKGMFVRRGEKFGDFTVADIRTASLVLESIAATNSRTSTKEFGDKVDVKQSDVTALLQDFAPVRSASTTTNTGYKAAGPQLSEDEQKGVLERLKEKRKKSLGNN